MYFFLAPKRKVGRPSKATPELIERILEDIADGFTEHQACAGNGVSRMQFYEWQKRPEFPDLRARKEYVRIKEMRQRILNCDYQMGDWKRFKWFLQCKFPDQFGDKPLVQLQQNNFQLSEKEAQEIDARMKMIEDELEEEDK